MAIQFRNENSGAAAFRTRLRPRVLFSAHLPAAENLRDIDWTLREGARAKIRVMVKRILNKYGYPPDLQEEAVKTVLQQAELLCSDWAS